MFDSLTFDGISSQMQRDQGGPSMFGKVFDSFRANVIKTEPQRFEIWPWGRN